MADTSIPANRAIDKITRDRTPISLERQMWLVRYLRRQVAEAEGLAYPLTELPIKELPRRSNSQV